jgi:hypothetical protein
MEGSKKFEDAALRGMTRHHVWKSRTSDLTVINLRDPSELLGTQEPTAPASTTAAVVAASTVASAALAVAAAPAVVSDAKRPTPATAAAATPQPQPHPQPRPTTGKQESLNALLSKLQLGRPTTDFAAAVAKTTQPPVTVPAATTTITATTAASVSSSAAAVTPSTATVALAVAAASPAYVSSAPSPPVRAAEVHNPTFPDLKESSGAVGQFEFITGTNIPGQGVVKKTEELNEASSMALFHDPLWGGSSLLDAFSTPSPARKSPKPPQRASLAELYATTATTMTAATASANTQNPINAFHTATPPAAMHTPMASPPVPTMTSATTLSAAMAPQPVQMMGGMVSTPAPHMATSFPMYTMPLQYVAHPQFAGGVVYNSAAFFPYGATTMMMPQQVGQHMPQGFPMTPAGMMRPGTNVKAMPFVPGSTM